MRLKLSVLMLLFVSLAPAYAAQWYTCQFTGLNQADGRNYTAAAGGWANSYDEAVYKARLVCAQQGLFNCTAYCQATN